MEAYYAEFPLNSRPSEPHTHGKAEFIFVMKGELEITIGEEAIRLSSGDAAYFDSSVAHSYCRKGARALFRPRGDELAVTL